MCRWVFCGLRGFENFLSLFVGYGVSRYMKKSVSCLGGENLRSSVDFLFGRESGEAYGAAYPPPPTTPEPTCNSLAPQTGHCANN